MSKKQASHDPHPVRTSIIASVIGAVIGPIIVSLIPGAWSYLAKIVANFCDWLTTAHQVPGLLLIVFIFATILTVGAAFRFLRRAEPSLSWEDYTRDNFFGLIWQWAYYGQEIFSVACLCPHCSMQVYPQDSSSYRAVERIAFRCDNCHRDLAEFQESWESLEDRVKRSVQRKLRTGEWRQLFSRNSP